ncbi:aromatic acid exporter family protein [Tissierella sp. MB52-C2]|uniref:FUSC family protein n=1 Tax=Tissierella sp. MB52-C2 TaxID=3070999 RepID=UPI00280B7222|nr:aromatic acid exporter family protein [Tissierella sp. MB52-C2]WMM25265.1 aromatic acid exporter family protein [Tissierella sp. MB52-C2]
MRVAKIGMRTIKTVIAVLLTLGISHILKLKSPLLASIAAIMTMESSISESFATGINRMYGTILGGVVALIMSYILPINFFFIGIGLIIIITICNIFKWEKAVRMAMIVFLSIALNYEGQARFYYAVFRTLDTLIGVVIGTAINYFIRPPNGEEKIKNIINNAYLEIKDVLEMLIWNKEIDKLEKLKSEITNIGEGYKIFIKDLKFHIGRSNNADSYHKLFNSFEKIHNHLSVICSIKESPIINCNNRGIIENYFNRKIPDMEYDEMDDLDLIYNYHLEQILSELAIIDSMI